MTSTAIATLSPITDDQLTLLGANGGNAFADAIALLDTLGIKAESMSEYGTGFKVVEKDALLGVDLLILSWRFNAGSYTDAETGEKGTFVSVEAVTKYGEKVIFNDGSSGIRDQLLTVTKQREEKGHPHPQAGLAVTGGLTVSRYFRNAAGDISRTEEKGYDPASTYYLSA